MNPWERLREIQPSWTASIATLAALVALLFVRRLLPPEERHRGKLPLLFLVLAVALRLAATAVAAMGAEDAWTILNLLSVLFMAFGMVGAASMLLFDILLYRMGLRMPSVLRDLLQLVAAVIVVLDILRRTGVNLISLVTTSAVLTAVIGLALQNTIANLFAGLALQVDRTLSVGDWIRIDDKVVRIAQIKWRSTQVITKDGDTIMVPNGELLTKEVMNFSKPSGVHRQSVKVSFHYRHPPNDVKKVLAEAAASTPGVLTNPPPDCVPLDFGDSGILYGVRYWIDDMMRDETIDAEVRTRLWYAARRAGLEIPFPIRTVLMTEMTEARENAEARREEKERLAVLAGIDLFAPLDDEDRKTLAGAMTVARFAAGEPILRQGEPGDSCFVVAEGQVGVLLEADGVKRDVATLSAGDFFGEMSLLTGAPRAATCVARSEVVAYVIGHECMEAVLERKPQLAEAVSRILAERQVTLEGEREGLSAEARKRRADEAGRRLLRRIQDFFHLR